MKLYEILTVLQWGTVCIKLHRNGTVNTVFVGDACKVTKDDDVWGYLFHDVLGCGCSDKNEFVINVYKPNGKEMIK